MSTRTPLTDAEASALRALHRAATQETWYDLLGVPAHAGPGEIEAAYHALARTWHPDRFYRRDLGDLSAALEEVFVTATRASRTLSDPTRRASYDQELRAAGKQPRTGALGTGGLGTSAARVGGVPPTTSASVGGAPRSAPSPGLPPRPAAPRSALYQQVAGQVAERVGKARALVQQARADMTAGQWARAESNLKLALTWDPQATEVQRLLEEATRHANVQRARMWMAQAEGEEEVGRNREALVLYKKVADTDPPDATFYLKLGRLILSVDQDERAVVQAFRKAVNLAPQDVEAQMALGEAYVRVGLAGPARRCAEAVLAMDARHAGAKALLKKL